MKDTQGFVNASGKNGIIVGPCGNFNMYMKHSGAPWHRNKGKDVCYLVCVVATLWLPCRTSEGHDSGTTCQHIHPAK